MHDVVFVNNVHTYYIHVANFTYTYLLCILTNALQTKCRYIYIYIYYYTNKYIYHTYDALYAYNILTYYIYEIYEIYVRCILYTYTLYIIVQCITYKIGILYYTD